MTRYRPMVAQSVVSTEGSRPDPTWHRAHRYSSGAECGQAIQLRYLRSIEGDPPSGARRCRKCDWETA